MIVPDYTDRFIANQPRFGVGLDGLLEWRACPCCGAQIETRRDVYAGLQVCTNCDWRAFRLPSHDVILDEYGPREAR